MKKISFVMLFVLIVSLLAGCAPYGATKVETVGPNETAFLIPLIGDTGQQAQFQSVDFLRSKQVAVKQVEIPVHKHQTGRNATYDIEFLPSAVLIKVDRTTITREWTSKKDTGTSASNQAFALETKESIGFQLGATCSALIKEEDAATFLYFFAGVPLAKIMDENVRGYIQQELFDKFGQLTLEESRTQKTRVIKAVFEDVVAKFSPMGITVTSFGGDEGLIYDSDAVQNSIDQVFQSQQMVLNNQQIATAQAVENQKLVAMAEAMATATVVAGDASAAVLKANGEQLAAYPDLVAYEIAKRSQGNVPSTVVLGSGGGNNTLPFAFLLNQNTSGQPTPRPTPTITPTPTVMPSPTAQPSPTPTAQK